MGLTAKIAQQANINVHVHHNAELIAHSDMDAFLTEAALLNHGILGLDGFSIEPPHIAPDMGAIADFSELASNSEILRSIQQARHFIEKVSKPHLFYEIVFMDE